MADSLSQAQLMWLNHSPRPFCAARTASDRVFGELSCPRQCCASAWLLPVSTSRERFWGTHSELLSPWGPWWDRAGGFISHFPWRAPVSASWLPSQNPTPAAGGTDRVMVRLLLPPSPQPSAITWVYRVKKTSKGWLSCLMEVQEK